MEGHNFAVREALKKLGVDISKIPSKHIDYSVHDTHDRLSKGKKLSFVDKIISLPNLKFLNVNKEVLSIISETMIKYKLDPTDAIHVATMLNNSIDVIISQDKHFDNINSITRKSLK